MFRNYLIIAARNILKNKLFSAINILGLAIGLAACILIILFVNDELSQDTWVIDAERVARVESIWPIAGRKPLDFSKAPPPVATTIANYFPNEIETSARLRFKEVNIRVEDRIFSDHLNYVSQNFLDIFNLLIIEGDAKAVYSGNSLLLSEKMAYKYFGSTSALGKVITIDGKTDLKVVGVFEDVSSKSHLSLDFVTQLDTGPNPWMNTAWSYVDSFYHYVKFREGYSIKDIQPRLKSYIQNTAISENPDPDFDPSSGLVMDLVPLLDIHLKASKSQPIKVGGNYSTLVSLLFIGLMILLIGSVNFMNLSTVRAMRREREVGIRKVVGAKRSQLVVQFIGESVFTAVISLIIALITVEILLPWFNEFLNKTLVLNIFDNYLLSIGLIGLTLFVAFLGGVYPAVFMSSFKITNSLKGKGANKAGSPIFRQALVVFQFSISVGLIISTSIVFFQTEFVRTMDLGFDKEHMLVIRGIDSDEISNSAAIIKDRLTNIRGVVGASWSSDTLPKRSNNNVNISMKGENSDKVSIVERMYVDTHFFNMFDIEVIAGRSYSSDILTDTLLIPEDENLPVSRKAIVNESFLSLMGLSSPEEAINTEFIAPAWYSEDRNLVGTIVGVIKDFHMRSARDHYTPMIFFNSSAVLKVLNVKIKSTDLSATLAEIDNLWSEIVPNVSIKRSFVEDDFNALYIGDEKSGQMFAIFAILAVVVSCSGLFGLASFTADLRRKEISIRKILGAGLNDILQLLSWQYLKPILMANLIAWPIAFVLMQEWLNGFTYRIDMNMMFFIGAGMLSLLIAYSTIAAQLYKLANVRPINALREE